MNDNLDNNLWMRTNEKPYNCKICNEVLSKKDILNNYLWSHPGEKPHMYEVHNKTFSEKDNLNKYLWTWITSENPHVNEVCKKRFFLSYDFKKHF